jgi:hypothetical protein
MKKCPYCAEEVNDEAIKCRWCGERLDAVPEPPSFARFEEWLKRTYPAYRVVSRNAAERFVVLNKEQKSFSPLAFVLLLLLWVLPGLIYAMVTLSGKGYIALTVRFAGDGSAESVSDPNFAFLARGFNKSIGLVTADVGASIAPTWKMSRRGWAWMIVGAVLFCLTLFVLGTA